MSRKPNYNMDKRNRERARKKKKEEKRQRKLESHPSEDVPGDAESVVRQ